MGGLLGAAVSVGYLYRHDESSSAWAGTFLILGPVGGATGGALLGCEVAKKTVVIHVTSGIH
jgi:hypothetical protein